MTSPNAGLDMSLPLPEQQPNTAVMLDNFLCRRRGVMLRHGSQRWKTNLGAPSAVLSLMAYNPPRGTASTFVPRLFAGCDNMNIYEVTSQTDEATVPPVAQAIAGQLAPGRLSYTNFSTPGTNFLVVCAAGAGVWTFDHAGGWINQTAAITGTAGANLQFDFVMAWKNRLWFVQNNTTKAWYLPVNSIAGAAAAFDFGALFVHGGDLKAMASWTLDAGDGIDDKLVIVGRGGDVLIYEGTDPTAAATFQIKGRWFTGRPPLGRRFLSKYAGDLTMVTELGIEYMSQLVQGRGLLDPMVPGASTPARRFNEEIGLEVRSTRDQVFWQLLAVPSQEGIVLMTPFNTANRCHQFFLGTLAQAWSRLTGWPSTAMEEFEGSLYYGTADGKVNKAFTSDTDDQLSTGVAGSMIKHELQTAFIAPQGDKMHLKRPQLVFVTFQGSRPPEVKLQINTEWSTQPVPGSPPLALITEAQWDVAKWDLGKWGADVNTYGLVVGVEGLGIYFSLRLSVRGAPGTAFNSWSPTYEQGGIM